MRNKLPPTEKVKDVTPFHTTLAYAACNVRDGRGNVVIEGKLIKSAKA